MGFEQEHLYYVYNVEPASNTATYTVYEIPSTYAERLRRLDKYVESKLKEEFPKAPKGLAQREQYAHKKQELRDYVSEKKREILKGVRRLAAAEEALEKSGSQLTYFTGPTGKFSRGDVSNLEGIKILKTKPINITRLF